MHTQIDEFILTTVDQQWQKVAMVIARALTSKEFVDTEDEEELVATRVYALIEDGRLQVQGNPRNWRHSEVRRI